VQYEKKYDIPERILFMALESVLYDEDQVDEREKNEGCNSVNSVLYCIS
jgi:hypothetical protein